MSSIGDTQSQSDNPLGILGESIHNAILDVSNHVSWFLQSDKSIKSHLGQNKNDGEKNICSADTISVASSTDDTQSSLHHHPQSKKKPDRKRLLALHGSKSNNQVTKMQLQNLNITDDDYDIVFLNGLIPEEEPDPHLQGIVNGPFYSWVDSRKDIKQCELEDSLRSSINELLSFIEEYGPFDGLYAFSSGSFIATMAIASLVDPHLRKRLLLEENNSAIADILPAKQHSSRGGGSIGGIYFGKRSLSIRTSVRSKSGIFEELADHGNIFSDSFKKNKNLQEHQHQRGDSVLDGEEGELGLSSSSFPFKFVILACSSSGFDTIHPNLDEFVKAMEFVTPSDISTTTLCPGSISCIPSFHIIGTEDSCKARSEEIACLFSKRIILYQPGGHYISNRLEEDLDLQSSIKEFITFNGNVPPSQIQLPQSMKFTSEMSSFALLPESQVALVKLNFDVLTSVRNTILSALKAQRPNKPFMYDARVQDPTKYTSYGDIVDFIERGHGDLRRLGVKDGDAVAYCTPPGGSATATLAFLSIGSQTSAVPLAPNLTKADTLDALDQFNVKHLILFEGVKCESVQAAFKEYALKTEGVTIHTAKMNNKERPGIFEYILSEEEIRSFNPSAPYLRLPENGICLLLRTSGTTARPKGVPLKQGDLVKNGKILASSMGLQESDVCYSIMPLYHIGGISASVLCTLVTGGALCCDGCVFTPDQMIDALALSRPQPTWYSSVPTIHNATVSFLQNFASTHEKYSEFGIHPDGVWKHGHSLRMIRSGAAALLAPDAKALSRAYGGIPIRPTYSMSEQMPITQPPLGMERPGTVGVPVASSLAIVSAVTLRPLPPGVAGEVAISGPTVMDRYLNNADADKKSFFYLTLKGVDEEGTRKNSHQNEDDQTRYFLTGDVGILDRDGFLSLTGRAKEMIKKGGEQVSPFEVEEFLMNHPIVQTAVCFSVPSKLYGEEVGCALVLKNEIGHQQKDDRSAKEIILKIRSFLKTESSSSSSTKELAPLKWPTHWKIVLDHDLPKTNTKKYIRVGLAEKLGMKPEEQDYLNAFVSSPIARSPISYETLSGFRFCLSCYVMFMHIGSTKSWGVFNNLRGFPWHVHVFFTLGGYSMASPMNPIIKRKFRYFRTRFKDMYPMYALAVLFGLANLLVVCRPSTFRKGDFHWDAQPDDLYIGGNGDTAPLFCEGTPATPNSYWLSLTTTLIVYSLGLSVFPFWYFNWWIGYYLWFSSMYYQCLAIFPSLYNYFFNRLRGNVKYLLRSLTALLLLNYAIVLVPWFLTRNAAGYNHVDQETGMPNPLEEYNPSASLHNQAILSFYLFGPFWVLYFIVGMMTAFLYHAYRPTEKHNFWVWGMVADYCTFVMVVFSILQLAQGKNVSNDTMTSPGDETDTRMLSSSTNIFQWNASSSPTTWSAGVAYSPINETVDMSSSSNDSPGFFMRPREADSYLDNAQTNRLWDNIYARLFCPITTLWIFALSTGEGLTSKLLRSKFLVESLAPHSYNCFLFHQMVAQWYFAITRQGHWWNWWRYRKEMYWFSPKPCPVEWYEYFFIVGLVVCFSSLVTQVWPIVAARLHGLLDILLCRKRHEASDNDDFDIEAMVCKSIENMTGIEAALDLTLGEVGLGSIGIPVLAAMFTKEFSSKACQVTVMASDLMGANTVGEIAEVLKSAKALAESGGL